MYKYLKGRCKEGEARLFLVVSSDRTRGNGHKLKHGWFLLDIRKHFSILGYIITSSGHGPEQPALGSPA